VGPTVEKSIKRGPPGNTMGDPDRGGSTEKIKATRAFVIGGGLRGRGGLTGLGALGGWGGTRLNEKQRGEKGKRAPKITPGRKKAHKKKGNNTPDRSAQKKIPPLLSAPQRDWDGKVNLIV